MRWLRSLLSAALIALPMISFAAEIETCAVSANPAKFNHQRVRGIVNGLTITTSRSGKKSMTFLLSSPAGCGGIVVYAQGPATLSNSDRLEVEGIFAIEHRREGSTFHNQIEAKKITALAVMD